MKPVAKKFITRENLKKLVVWAAGIVTLGSGVMNIYSVLGPALDQRLHILKHQVLHHVFALETTATFIHISRSMTLLIGFALVISSINIFKRKKRALQMVVLLSFLSVFSHLFKGLDYEEALFSLLLALVLLRARRAFLVKSAAPDLVTTLIRLAVAAWGAILYGVLGFWLLDPRHFGVNFLLGESIRRTFLFLTLTGDPTLVPRTHYGMWFIDSLYLITTMAMGYCLLILFRPVIYRFSTRPHELAQAADAVHQFGRSSLDYFKSWPDKSFFFSPSKRCLIAYRVGGNFAIALSDPVGPTEEIDETVQHFSQMCAENDWGLAFHQVLPDFLPVYTRLGWRKLKVGDEALVDLQEFSLEGKSMKKIRHYVNQLEKTGIHIMHHEPPVPDAFVEQAETVSDAWLEIPGRRERRFTLGWFTTGYIRSTPLFAVVDGEGRMLAFANLIPSGRPGETTIDLMRHLPDAPAGVMDFLFVKLFQHAREQGFTRFSLGMAPLAGFQEHEEASMEERAVHFFLARLDFLFSFTGLKQYKAKYAQIWEPRYTVYRNPLDLPRSAIALGKVSEMDSRRSG